ncbi:MAG: DUF3891 family protein [Thermoanaerobaculales bacterium]
MFIHRDGNSAGSYLIPQVSHAWLAWQVAQHWGNRSFARPAPLAETLASVLLHDCGWSEFDAAPSLDSAGKPRSFDRLLVEEHLEIWRTSVMRCAQYSRYSALLVAAHFAAMAERKTADLLEREDTAGARLAQSFGAEMERLEESWKERLGVDARYEPYLDGAGREANALLLDACDRISVFLCASLPSPFEVRALNSDGEVEVVRFEAVDESTWRLSPWPLEGDRLRIQCEGRRLASTSFSSREEFHKTLARAPVNRLVFTLLRSSAVG